jgi:hypothetical protein
MIMLPIQSSCRSSWLARNGWERFCCHSSDLAGKISLFWARWCF